MVVSLSSAAARSVRTEAVTIPSSSSGGSDQMKSLRPQNSMVATSATWTLPSLRGWFLIRWAHSTAAFVANAG